GSTGTGSRLRAGDRIRLESAKAIRHPKNLTSVAHCWPSLAAPGFLYPARATGWYTCAAVRRRREYRDAVRDTSRALAGAPAVRAPGPGNSVQGGCRSTQAFSKAGPT